MFATWRWTVCSLMKSRSAIAWLFRPLANQPKNLDLARRQARRLRSTGDAAAAAGRQVRIEHARGRERARGWRRAASRSSIARRASSAAASGGRARRITPASSTRARPVSNGAPLSLNRSTASSRCSRADFGIARARRHQARREAGQRAQRPRPGLRRDRLEFGHRLRRFLDAALLDAGADHQFQRGRALGPVLRRQPPQMPLGEIRAGLKSPRSNVTLARPSDASGWDPPRSNSAIASSSFP